MEEKDKNVEEIEMDLNLDSKKTSSKINSRNLDKEILKKYCMGKLTKDELSRMSKSARKTCERKLKLLKKKLSEWVKLLTLFLQINLILFHQ